MYNKDKRIVMTLDAGGTNLVFSAMQGNEEIVTPICLSANPYNLNECLQTLVKGFTQIKEELKDEPVAISFAFPGPADYKNGIIGDLPNFPSFRGGVALGPFLKEKFGIPVFINNDGNLFAYGEALAGALPQLNAKLAAAGSPKRYKNLVGVTLGTGFGAGVVIDNELLTGDNGCGGDVWVFRNKFYSDKIVEESVSIRAVIRVYNSLTSIDDKTITPKDIFDIAEGTKSGNNEAAIKSFAELGKVAGDAIAHLLTFTDGIVVIGGGITGAAKYILPSLMGELKSELGTFAGQSFPRLQMDVYNLNDENDFTKFLTNKTAKVKIPDTETYVDYNYIKQSGILLSTLGTNKAVSLGAYAFALQQLDKQ
ncbi:ROK family protein [Dysgonomonas reticulitermitis]